MPYSGSVALPIRGGNWNNGTNAGVFNCNLNNSRGNTSSNIGFRSALVVTLVCPSYGKHKTTQRGIFLF